MCQQCQFSQIPIKHYKILETKCYWTQMSILSLPFMNKFIRIDDTIERNILYIGEKKFHSHFLEMLVILLS